MSKTEKKPRARRGRGEGAIGQQNGRWFAEVSLGHDGNGKRIRKRVYGDSKKAVQDELRKMQDQAAVGGVVQTGTLAVGAMLTKWLDAMKPAWANGTHASHQQHVENHLRPRLGGVRLSMLNALHIQNAMQEMEKSGASSSMRRHVLVTLRAAMSWAVNMKLASANIALAVPLPAKSKHRSEGITGEHVAAFLEAAEKDRLHALYILAIDSGLRQGELLALEWPDFSAERGTIRVNKALEEVGGVLALKAPKNQSSVRMVKLSAATVEALQKHQRAMLKEGFAASPIFCGPRLGKHLRKSDVYRHSFEPILKRAGLKFRFHDLRHATASLLLAGGVDVKTVQSRLGHAAASTTMNIYAHALDRGQQTAADAMQGILTSKAGKPGRKRLG